MYRVFIMLFFYVLALFHVSVEAAGLTWKPAYEHALPAGDTEADSHDIETAGNCFFTGYVFNDEGVRIRRSDDYHAGEESLPAPAVIQQEPDGCILLNSLRPVYPHAFNSKAITSCYTFIFRLTPF